MKKLYIIGVVFVGLLSQLSGGLVSGYKSLCVKGDMLGCYQVGEAYWNGDEVKENLGLAKQFFELACEGEYYRSCAKLSDIYLGDKQLIKKPDFLKAKRFAKIACEHKVGWGCKTLDWMYQKGKGVKKNKTLSKDYLEKAMKYCHSTCDQNIDNNINSKYKNIGFDCALLGNYYGFDKRIKINFKKAYLYYKRGCKLGDGVSCEGLGGLYEIGKYVKRDAKETLKYFNKACDLKDYVGCSLIGMIYESGEEGFISKNLKKAKEYYQKACELGDKDSCENANKISLDNPCNGMELEECLNKGIDYYYGKGVKKDFKVAKRIFTYGCEKNEEQACFGLGLMYLNGSGVLKDHKTSLKFFKKSCKLGFGSACSNAAWIYMHGKKVKHNKRQAVLYEEKGCYELKSGISCYTLGNYYLTGRGVRKNRKKARELYKKSCELGYKDACKMY